MVTRDTARLDVKLTSFPQESRDQRLKELKHWCWRSYYYMKSDSMTFPYLWHCLIFVMSRSAVSLWHYRFKHMTKDFSAAVLFYVEDCPGQSKIVQCECGKVHWGLTGWRFKIARTMWTFSLSLTLINMFSQTHGKFWVQILLWIHTAANVQLVF